MNCDLIIYNANELLTLAGSPYPRRGKEMDDLAVVENGAVAVKDDKILDTGSTEDILRNYSCENKINAAGKVIMPGFVDSHTHPVFFDTRENEFEMRILGKTYVEISKAGGGIRSSIAGVRNASFDELYDKAKKRLSKFIANGTTVLEAKSGYGLDTESELKMLKVINKLKEDLPIDIIPTFMGAHEFPAEYKDNHKEYIRILCEEMMPAVAESGLAEYCDIFTEEHVYSVDESRIVMQRAKELGFKLRIHADEIESVGGAELAAELGAVSADHLGAASDKGIIAMRDAGVIATLLPGTLFSLRMKEYARARYMIDNGLPVAIATDYNPGSCNCDDMQLIISLSVLQMGMTVKEAVVAATINAAHALNRGNKIGSLEKGKQADILIMDMPSYRFIPYHLGSSNAETVIKNGKIIYQNK
ncbi:MAG: imidazolonepropionase [Candidatus Cloacimonadota bacterium]|nr:MAG: imidazolonepropionase [Candidatus Cloacimonadota bacterium]